MVGEHIKGDFTLEAQKNLLSRYGEPEPIALKDVAAIWGHQSMNAKNSSIKIMDKGGQEMRLTPDGQATLQQAADEIKKQFLPARDPENNEAPCMVNPHLVSFDDKHIDGDEDTATVTLPNKRALYLIDEEFGFSLDAQETRKALNIPTTGPSGAN